MIWFDPHFISRDKMGSESIASNVEPVRVTHLRRSPTAGKPPERGIAPNYPRLLRHVHTAV